MTVKFTYNEDKETFAFKGLSGIHVMTIAKLLTHVRMDTGEMANAASELLQAYENSEYGGDVDFLVAETNFVVSFDLSDGGVYTPVVFGPDGDETSATIELALDSELESSRG